jgi:hypothetical protein
MQKGSSEDQTGFDTDIKIGGIMENAEDNISPYEVIYE